MVREQDSIFLNNRLCTELDDVEIKYGFQAWIKFRGSQKELKMYRFKHTEGGMLGVESELTKNEIIYFPQFRAGEVNKLSKLFGFPLIYIGDSYKTVRYAKRMGGKIQREKIVCSMYKINVDPREKKTCSAMAFECEIDNKGEVIDFHRLGETSGFINNTLIVERVRDIDVALGKLRVGKSMLTGVKDRTGMRSIIRV